MKEVINFPTDTYYMNENDTKWIGENSCNFHVKSEGDGDGMDNDKILEKYLEKVDKDTYELKKDVHESEKRLHEYIRESEGRMDRRFENMEKRFENMDRRFENMEKLILNQNDKLKSLEDTVNKSIYELKEKVDEKMDDNRKFMWGIMFSVIGIAVAAILAVIMG